MIEQNDSELTVRIYKQPSITEISRGDGPKFVTADEVIIGEEEFTKTFEIEMSVSPGTYDISIRDENYINLASEITIPETNYKIEKTYYLNSKEEEEILLEKETRRRLAQIRDDHNLENIADALEFAVDSCLDHS
ncbi:hypothetical protein [Halostella salina]|uniref:hypothetical protein n=1 Tax=Halostella salina TaxID=1547897 RepID=UPI0013CE7DCA|nr:hypothetical protein [Halostella salina]